MPLKTGCATLAPRTGYFDGTFCSLAANASRGWVGVSLLTAAILLGGAYHARAGETISNAPTATPAWSSTSDLTNTLYGNSVGGIGDIDGDGYADVAISDPGYPEWGGRVWAYSGTAEGLSATPSFVIDSDEPTLYLGEVLAAAGDVNSDGYADVLIGAPQYDTTTRQSSGGLRLYPGSSTGISAPGWVGADDQGTEQYGESAAGSGDVDGDGFDDVVVGDSAYDLDRLNEGAAWWYRGGPDGLEAESAWSAHGDRPEAWFGSAVAGAGDVNGDGYADLLIGSYRYQIDPDATGYDGRADVFLGSSEGPEATPAWSQSPTGGSEYFGWSVSGVGDVNADGYADVLVGALLYESREAQEGGAFLYFGGAAGPSPTEDWMAQPDNTGASFGNALAGAGDVNGDGFDDFVIGAHAYSDTESDEGAIFLWLGASDGPTAAPAWKAVSGQWLGGLGYSLAGAGDVDGDGMDDVLAGAPGYYERVRQGRAYPYAGPSGGADADGDGHAPTRAGGDDCDDADPSVSPSAPETCDGRDEDCDGLVDEDAVDAPSWYADRDRDGYGDPARGTPGCDAPTNTVADATDCDDLDNAVHPGATEVCDPASTDEDCDGLADDADPSVDASTATSWYPDVDGDGYGASGTPSASCHPPDASAQSGTDCDDANPTTHPGAPEVCDGDDNDCDPATIETCADTGTPGKEGCGCDASAGPGLAWLGALAVLAARRRRRGRETPA